MAKFKTKGLILKLGATASPTDLVTQLGDGTLNLGDREAALDVSDHSNSSGVVDKLDNGFKDTWSLDAEIFWDPAATSHELIRASQDSGATVYATVVVPDTGAAQVTGPVRIRSFSAPVPVKGSLRANISIEAMAAGTYSQ